MTATVTQQRVYVPSFASGAQVTQQRVYAPSFARGAQVTQQRVYVASFDTALNPGSGGSARRRQQTSVIA